MIRFTLLEVTALPGSYPGIKRAEPHRRFRSFPCAAILFGRSLED